MGILLCTTYIFLYSVASDLYYVGYTTGINQRLGSHNETSLDSFTSKHRPWVLCALFRVGEKEAVAVQVERFINKQKSRKLIERLIDPAFIPEGQLAQLVRVPHMRD
jgi:putative endonuclease